MGHETPWTTSTARNAKTAGHCFTAIRPDVSVGGCHIECVGELGGALDAGLPERRSEGTPTQTGFRAPAPVIARPETPVGAASGGGPAARRLHDQLMDVAADCQADPETFSDPLSPGPRVAGDTGVGMDVAEARAAGFRAGRGSHRTLEEIPLAPDKKKPTDLGPVSSFSTKAAFCLSPTSVRPGPRWVIPLSCGIAPSGIGSRRSRALRSRRDANVSASMSAFTLTTSPAWKSPIASATSCAISGGRWCFSGTGAVSISAPWFETSFDSSHGSTRILSRPTRRNSIQPSLFGPTPSAPYPIARPKTSASSVCSSTAACTESKAHNHCCGPVSVRPNCHGHER